MSLNTLLTGAALVCFLLAAAGVQSRVGLLPLGAALVTLTLLV